MEGVRATVCSIQRTRLVTAIVYLANASALFASTPAGPPPNCAQLAVAVFAPERGLSVFGVVFVLLPLLSILPGDQSVSRSSKPYLCSPELSGCAFCDCTPGQFLGYIRRQLRGRDNLAWLSLHFRRQFRTSS